MAPGKGAENALCKSWVVPLPNRRGDLHEHRAKNVLAKCRCCPVMVPGPLPVVGHQKPGFAFRRCQLFCLACPFKRPQPGFALQDQGKAILPLPGQVVEHVAVAVLDGMELHLFGHLELRSRRAEGPARCRQKDRE